MTHLMWWKGKNYNQEYSIQQGSHSDTKEKKASDKQKLREFCTTKPALPTNATGTSLDRKYKKNDYKNKHKTIR